MTPEAACLIGYSPRPETLVTINDHTTLLVCGMGAERAKRAARQLIDVGAERLVSCGTAGATSADLEPGDLIIPETIAATGGQIYPTASQWRSSTVNRLSDCPCSIYLGQLADSMHVLTTAADKWSLQQEIGSQAVDMESAAIAGIAAKHEIPYIVIRAISDSSKMMIPDAVIAVSDAYGRIRVTRLIKMLATRPGQIPQLIQLATGFMAAAKTLKWIGRRLEQVLGNE
ncbi:MAG: hypothetical protein ACE5GZ_10095 [Gammaproteobacteria bacterium]